MSRELLLAIQCVSTWVGVCCLLSLLGLTQALQSRLHLQYYNSFKSFKEPVQDCLQSIKTILKRLPVSSLLIVPTVQQPECRITLAVQVACTVAVSSSCRLPPACARAEDGLSATQICSFSSPVPCVSVGPKQCLQNDILSFSSISSRLAILLSSLKHATSADRHILRCTT